MPDRLTPIRTLKDLGYYFNQKGELRTMQADEPFKFINQEHYEQLGEATTHEVYNLMESVGLQRLLLKKHSDAKSDEHYSFVFASPEYEIKPTLLILIHGMGAVRAGQWARRLILNESLERGSMLPYIEKALNRDWGVLVTNSNLNEHFSGDCNVSLPLQYSKTPEMHMESVFYRFVRFTRASSIYVVAHSRGGHDIATIIENFPDEHRIQCVCLTDSWFEFSNSREQQPIVINWAAKPKNSIRKPTANNFNYRNVQRVHQIWAGTTEHERSSYMAIESIFHVLEHHPDETNIGKLLIDAWDIMDPPPLDIEGIPPKPKIISKDEAGNIKVNEEMFGVTVKVEEEDETEEEEVDGEPRAKITRIDVEE